MVYNIDLSVEEIDFLKSKKIVRNNIINYKKDLVSKLDEYCEIYNLSFGELIYIIINKIEKEPKCLNCNINKPKFISTLVGFKKYCSNKCSNSHDLVKRKKESVYLEKWGVDNPSKSQEIKDKLSIIGKSQSEETKKKRKETCISKWGYETNLNLPEIKEKAKASLSKKEVKEKRENTCLEKCAHKSHLSSLEIKEKTKKTNKDKFGREYPLKKININFNDIPKEKTEKEIDLYNYIYSIYNGQIIQSYRDGLEIDIYLPELKLGIEFNGLYWHSDIYKQKEYHIKKLDWFKERNIRLIQIWEDDWNFNNDIIKSQIKNWIGLSENKIGSRKCEIKEVSSYEANLFLDENHIQGRTKSNIRLGLFYKNELVSLMTFDNLEGRNRMPEGEWNLSRFCNKLDHVVMGGASKLLSYFINNWYPNRIISYADKDWSVGGLYEKIGFNKISETRIDYKYVISGKRIHKSNFKKSRLNTNLTESEEMKKRSISKVYDSGKIKFEMTFQKILF
jgi:hypothetical protein